MDHKYKGGRRRPENSMPAGRLRVRETVTRGICVICGKDKKFHF